MKTHNYLFTSLRLGFRNWENSDRHEFAKLNSDPDVMAHFPELLTEEETIAFLSRLQTHYLEHGYTYFVVDLLENNEFIGFIGIANPTYEADFTPAVDIGWRLKKTAWGNGYAVEGAKRCLQFAFEDCKLDRIIATCPVVNKPSENVMKKLGMEKIGTFNHPKLIAFPILERCFHYEIRKA